MNETQVEVKQDPLTGGWAVLDHQAEIGYGFVNKATANEVAADWPLGCTIYAGDHERYERTAAT